MDIRPVILSWRSDLRDVQILLSRPMIGHTPRKLPPLGAISRFIAVLRAGSPLSHSLYIIKENPLDVKRIFSVFHEILKIFLAVPKCGKMWGFTRNHAVFPRLTPDSRKPRSSPRYAENTPCHQGCHPGESPESPPRPDSKGRPLSFAGRCPLW